MTESRHSSVLFPIPPFPGPSLDLTTTPPRLPPVIQVHPLWGRPLDLGLAEKPHPGETLPGFPQMCFLPHGLQDCQQHRGPQHHPAPRPAPQTLPVSAASRPAGLGAEPSGLGAVGEGVGSSWEPGLVAEMSGAHRRHPETGENPDWLRVVLSPARPWFRESGDGVEGHVVLPAELWPPHALGLVPQAHVQVLLRDDLQQEEAHAAAFLPECQPGTGGRLQVPRVPALVPTEAGADATRQGGWPCGRRLRGGCMPQARGA